MVKVVGIDVGEAFGERVDSERDMEELLALLIRAFESSDDRPLYGRHPMLEEAWVEAVEATSGNEQLRDLLDMKRAVSAKYHRDVPKVIPWVHREQSSPKRALERNRSHRG